MIQLDPQCTGETDAEPLNYSFGPLIARTHAERNASDMIDSQRRDYEATSPTKISWAIRLEQPGPNQPPSPGSSGKPPLSTQCPIWPHQCFEIFAASSGQENVARKALRENANVKGIDPITPLFEAVSNRHLGMVKLFVESGAPIDRLVGVETVHTGTWPAYLHYGLRGYADTALTKTTSLSHLGIMKLLLDHGANVDGTNGFDWTPLFMATHNDNIAPVEMLIRYGASTDLVTDAGWTPLSWVAFGCERIFKLLLESGAEINVGGHRQYNPLSQSICGSSRAIFNLLLDRNADLDRYGGSHFTKGQTPLWTALSQRYYETVGILLDEGANPNLPDIDRGKAVLWMAVVRGHEEVTRALLARGADLTIAPGGQTPLFAAVQLGNESAAKSLLEHRANPNTPSLPWHSHSGRIYQAPLARALMNADYSMAKLLIDHGANPNVRGWKNQTWSRS